MNIRLTIFLAGLAIALGACSSAEHSPWPVAGGTPPPPPPPVTSTPPPSLPYTSCAEQAAAAEPSLLVADTEPGGLWWGTLTNDTQMTTRTAEVMVSEDGRFRFLATNSYTTLESMNTQLTGNLAALGNTFTGTGSAFLEAGAGLFDNAYTGEVTVDGVVVAGDRITARWTAASGDTGCLDAYYDAYTYEQPEPVDWLAGTWDSYDNQRAVRAITVAADGSFVGQGAGGCRTVGRIGLADDRYGLYEVEQTITGCDIAGHYTGFAYLCYCWIDEWSLIWSIDNGTRAYRWFFED